MNRRRASPNAPGGGLGDIVEALRYERHLTHRQYRGAVLFLRDLRDNHGTSNGMVMQLGERVQSGSKARVPAGGDSIEHLDNVLKKLRGHERQLLAFLVKSRELERGTLADFGRRHSGYQTAKTMRAVTVGRIGALLDTLADEYLEQEG